MCTRSVQVDNLAHLGSKSEFTEKLQMQKENICFEINHSLKPLTLNFEEQCWCFFQVFERSLQLVFLALLLIVFEVLLQAFLLIFHAAVLSLEFYLTT